MTELDTKETGRVIHALAAVRDSEGSPQAAAAKLGISEELLLATLSAVSPKFCSHDADGVIRLTPMGSRFADQTGVFPWVNW